MNRLLVFRGAFLLSLAALAGCVTPSFNRHYFPEASRPIRAKSGKEKVFRVRVALALHRQVLRLDSPDFFTLSDKPPKRPEGGGVQGDRVQRTVLTAARVHGRRTYAVPWGQEEIRLEGKPYKGFLEILREKDGTLTAVNDVGLEDYVMGVVAGEVPSRTPLEALKAQAIAARTFVVYQRGKNGKKEGEFDVRSTSVDQMYEGSRRVDERIRKAVEETRGEILFYRDEPIEAMFHSNCGGRTSRAVDVWGEERPYLQSVSCDFGNKADHFRWKAEIRESDVRERLRRAGQRVWKVRELKPLDRDESGRIFRVEVRDEAGQRKVIQGSALRMALGPDVIKSTRFEVRRNGDKMVFTGRGWGHGVGLCQEGSWGMAVKGYRAFEILRHYYRGITVEKLKP